MFGTLRYVLATLVVFGHLWPFILGRANWSGHYAILTFFVLSGYLMTLILNDRYGFARAGLERYLTNRALRIYPPYWAAIALSASLLLAYPAAGAVLADDLGLPNSVGDWLQNVFIFGLHLPRSQWLIPPAWSLSVELVFYVAMGLVLARSRTIVLVWLGATAAYVAVGWGLGLVAGVTIAGPEWLPSKSASLAFSMGALVYHLRAVALPRWAAVAAALAYAVNLAVGPATWAGAGVAGVYVCVLCSFLLVWYLSGVRARDVPQRFARTDRVLGDLAYPIFLVHFQAAILVLHFGFDDAKPSGAETFWCSLPVVIVLAVLLHACIESPVARLRDRVRPARRASGA